MSQLRKVQNTEASQNPSWHVQPLFSENTHQIIIPFLSVLGQHEATVQDTNVAAPFSLQRFYRALQHLATRSAESRLVECRKKVIEGNKKGALLLAEQKNNQQTISNV